MGILSQEWQTGCPHSGQKQLCFLCQCGLRNLEFDLHLRDPCLSPEGRPAGPARGTAAHVRVGLAVPRGLPLLPVTPYPHPSVTEMYFPCSFTFLAPLGQNERIRGQSRLSVIHPLAAGARHKAAAVLEA